MYRRTLYYAMYAVHCIVGRNEVNNEFLTYRRDTKKGMLNNSVYSSRYVIFMVVLQQMYIHWSKYILYDDVFFNCSINIRRCSSSIRIGGVAIKSVKKGPST